MISATKALFAAASLAVAAGCAVGGSSLTPPAAGDSAGRDGGNIARALPLNSPTPTPTPAPARKRGNIARALPAASPSPTPKPRSR